METNKKKGTVMNKFKEKAVHGIPGFSLKIYKNDFNENIKELIPWHWHEELEFVLVTEGKIEISIASRKYYLGKGEGAFINANVLHQMKSVVGRESKLFSIVTHPDILGEAKNFLLTYRYINPIIKDENIKCQILSSDVKWQDGILNSLEEICVSYEEKEYAYEYRIHNLVCDIWLLLLREAWQERSEESEHGKGDEKRIYPALKYMQEHFAEPITLEDICKVMHVGKSECFRCFKRTIATSPMDYLLHYRVSMAAVLILNTEKPIADVALECGFNSSSYFCKVFRNIMECSPKDYRKKGKNRD